ncbi:MAG: hypothetical protein U9O06_03945 [Euryarchaeota archaeon]|nr:hypothetical protein [Euryarchaeota archaeon]
MILSAWFGTDRPIIGRVGSDPLSGAPGATDGLTTVCEQNPEMPNDWPQAALSVS